MCGLRCGASKARNDLVGQSETDDKIDCPDDDAVR